MNLEYFHPLFVHFPIALTVFGTILVAYGLLRRQDGATRAGLILFVASGVLVIPTYITGQVARAVLEDSSAFDRDLPMLDTHEDLGLVSLGALVALGIVAGIALGKQEDKKRPWGLMALALAASLLIAITAFYGGRLVFEKGIGVMVERASDRKIVPQDRK